MSEFTPETIEALRVAVGTKVKFEPGTVVKFDSTSRYNGHERDYNYAAIFAADHRWYLTGVNKHYGDRLTTNKFLEVLGSEDVHSVAIAGSWVEL